MKLEEIARAYVLVIELEDKIRVEAPVLLDEVSELRGDLHALLMDSLRENHIPFHDRTEASQIAFQMAQKPAVPR